jgi:haloacid dehalogenase superfamily, subfamily IA, variant 3 with third motif having DD or ED/haloacid dehalogenase superfamily, subfamily IA, variant 1 with third motif having Dx(3-4)D or Dx(3-4)E
MIKGIVFDLDGTLIDSNLHLAKSWVTVFKELGYAITVEYYFKELRGLSARDIIKKVTRIENDERIKDIIERRKEILSSSINDIKPFPEVQPTLSQLKLLNLKLAIASSLSYDIMQVLKNKLQFNQIEAWVSSDMVKEGKPKPDVFIEALKRINISSKESIIVGDSINDMIPAKSIGAIAVYIKRYKDDYNNIADYVINSLLELVEIAKRYLLLHQI